MTGPIDSLARRTGMIVLLVVWPGVFFWDSGMTGRGQFLLRPSKWVGVKGGINGGKWFGKHR